MDLYVIRHGQKAIANPDFDCAYNTPLSDTGKEQAEYLADFLADEDIDALYSSVELRALQTAKPVHDEVGVEWHAWPVFDEASSSTWRHRYEDDPETATTLSAWRTGEPIETPTAEELETWDGNYYLLSNLPDRFPVTLSQPFPWPEAWWVPHEAETRTQAYARVELGYEALLQAHDAEAAVAVICHGNSGGWLVDAARGSQTPTSFSNTGVTRLTGREDWSVDYMNRTGHLPPELKV